MNALFVTGAGTEIGKTYVSCALLRDMRARGIACDVLKPVLSGFEPGEAHGSDAGLLLRALGETLEPARLEKVSPWRYRAPLAPHMAAREEGRELPYEDVLAHCRARLAEARDFLLVEGAGGVMAPLGDHVTNLDLIAALGAPVLFVTGSYLGAVSHALTGLAVLKMRGCDVRAVIVNETAESVGLEATLAMLRPHVEAAPLLSLSRGAQTLRLP